MSRPPDVFDTTLAWLRQQTVLLADSWGQLPPERELANRANTCVATVRKALAQLVKEGHIVRRWGKGTFLNRRFANAVLPADQQATPTSLKLGLFATRGCSWNEAIGSIAGYAGIYTGMLARGKQYGCSFNLFLARPENVEEELDRIETMLGDGQLGGAILFGVDDPILQQRIVRMGKPAIIVDHWAHDGVVVDSVEPDSYEDVKALVAALSHLGHRHIAFVDRPLTSLNPNWKRGFDDGARENGVFTCDKWQTVARLEKEWRFSDAKRILKEWFQDQVRPTAVIAIDPRVAQCFAEAARDLRIDVPSPLSIVSYATNKRVGSNQLLLGGIEADWVGLGRKAIECLMSRIGGDRSAPKRILLRGTICLGDTVLPCCSGSMDTETR
ncbi:MAG: hypothetical protein AMXMBFR7_43040 [Planctomycetota bacterium]